MVCVVVVLSQGRIRRFEDLASSADLTSPLVILWRAGTVRGPTDGPLRHSLTIGSSGLTTRCRYCRTRSAS